MRRHLLCGVLVAGAVTSGALEAQAAPDSLVASVSPALIARVNAARIQLEQGDGETARGILDSLVRATPPASLDRAEALFWRATLAERVADAERDWRRVVVEMPLSPRTPDVLLRLGDLDMLRQRPVQARSHFERVMREFPGTPQRIRATLWLARSHVEQRDLVSGCRAFAALNRGEIPDGELQLQADELRRQCASVPIDSVAPEASAVAKPAPVVPASSTSASPSASTSTAMSTGGRFAVQVGAFETVQEARDMVARMNRRGFEARVDGEQRPFRVRVGRFATRSEAAKLLAQVKAAGVDAFIAELSR